MLCDDTIIYSYIHDIIYVYIYICIHTVCVYIYIYTYRPDTLSISQNSWDSAWTWSVLFQGISQLSGLECVVQRSVDRPRREDAVHRPSKEILQRLHIILLILQCRPAWWFPSHCILIFLLRHPKNEMIQSDDDSLSYFGIFQEGLKPPTRQGCV